MRKAEVLLAYLALTPGLRHPRERLINLLWSDRGEEQARNSLRQCLSAIRKSLGDAAELALLVDRSTVSLQPGLIEVDVLEFERLADIGDYESLATAADLYQGEFLEGIAIRDAACQEWLDSERSRFKRQFIEILLNLAETQLVSHDFGHAIKSAERLVKQDPLGESGWRLLMRSYFENGDRALQAFKRCQQAMRDELEVEPETATIELRDQIAGGETKPTSTATTVESTITPSSRSDHSIAVLPFDNLSGDPEQEYFSDGITDSIILNLSLFPGLNVKSRNSSFAFKQQIKSLGEISKELGVDYIVEGNIRRSEQHVRITVQLIEANGGNQIWGKRYDAGLTDLFELEEELSRAIAATVTGQIESELQRVAIAKGAAGQESYDLLLSGIYHNYRFNRQDTMIAIEKLNQCLALDPDNVRAHKQLYTCHLMNYLERWTDDYQASFELAAEHIKKAMALAPESPMVLVFYAQYLVFRGEFDQAAPYLDKALAINPNDPHLLATQALSLEIQGEAETALLAAERACQLDPYHPWAEWEVAVSQYISGQYEMTLETISKSRTSPGFIQIFGIASSVKLSKTDLARQALRAFLQKCREDMLSMPTTQEEWLQYTRENYPFKDPRINQELIDCLLKAGLEDEFTPRAATPESPGYSIAVLPFDNLSGDPEQEYFSDGITDSIILNLSLFPGLKVKSRNSSFAFKQQIKSPGEISQELDVDYIVEGSIRRSADRIRITVQLIQAASSNQIWGKRYDAEIDNLFDLEEELSRTIAATVTGQIESELQRIAIAKGAAGQQAYDLLLSGTYHFHRFTRQDTAIAIDKLTQCLAQDPDNLRAHVVLCGCHDMDYLSRWTEDHEASFEMAERHIRRAMELDPGFGPAQVYYGEFLTFKGELDKAAIHLDKALEINPNDTDALTTKAMNLQAQCKFDNALKLAEEVLALDPYHPWAEWELAGSQYFCGRYEKALDTISNFRTSPGFVLIYAVAANLKLGRIEAAQQALQAFLQDCRENMLSMPQSIDEWYEYTRDNYRFRDSQFSRDLVDSLVEAGLGEADALSRQSTASGVHSIAVLPFDNLSGDPSQEYFSDGITESIILNLSLFPGLNVKSRNSSFAFKQQIKSLGEISQELEVDYIVEGSIRKTEERIRVTVQLVEATSGNQVWGKRYDAEIDNLFELEEELSRTIAATVTGQIESDLQRIALAKGAADQQAYDIFLAGLYHARKFTAPGMKAAIEKFDQCLELDPDNVYAHAHLYWCHCMDWLERWVEDFESSFKLAEKHARRAIALGPEIGIAQVAYGEYLIFCKEFDKALVHVEQALAINPNDSDALATKAYIKIAQGKYDEALQIAALGYRLDPYHPWCDWELAEAQFYCGLYEESLQTIANSKNAPGFIRIYNIASNIELGRMDTARAALQEYLAAAAEEMKAFPRTREDWLEHITHNAPYENLTDEDLQINERLIEYLVQAGLEQELAGLTDNRDISSSIVVLPFDNLSKDPDQEYFSDGITDSIILNLSLFPGLNVKSRNASFAFKQQIKDLGEISRELEVDYLVEGSIRKSDQRIRINTQLIEAHSGNQVWGKRYDSDIDDLFELEEELSRTIATTVTGQIESDLQRIAIAKGAAHQQSYDLLLQGIYHSKKSTAAETAIAVEKLNQCLELDPGNALAHATLYGCHEMNWIDRLVPDFEASRKLCKVHASKALELNPELGQAQVAFAEYLSFNRDYDEAETHLKRALEINPNDSQAIAALALNLSCQGKFEAALEKARLALQLDPYHTWARWILSESQFFCGLYDDVLDTIADTGNPPGFIQIYKTAANVKLGRMEVANDTLKSFLQHCSESMLSMPRTIDEWLAYSRDNAPFADPAFNQEIIDCLVQAGLEEEIAGAQERDDPEALPSILVLPFGNLSGDPEQEYFSDGISESLIVNLSSFSGLTVKSRHTSFAYKNSEKSIEEIAAALEVQYMVEGSIRKFGNKVRITVQLSETESGNQIWGKRFESDLDSLFSIEEELVQTIAGTISGRIGREIKSASALKPAKSLKSYDYLMRAWHHMEKFNPQDTETAIEHLKKCIEIDPENAEGHTLLATLHINSLYENWTSDRELTLSIVRKHMLKALDLEPNNALTHAFTVEYYLQLGDLERAMFHAERSIELNPTLPEPYAIKAYILGISKKPADAIELADIAMKIDPYHYYMGWSSGEAYMHAGEFSRAIEAARTVPHMPASLQAQVAGCLAALGQLDEARVEMQRYRQRAIEEMPDYPRSLEAWKKLWRQNTPVPKDEDFDAFFDLLLQAGLCDQVEMASDEMPSIAVLPFENMSGDPEQEYFSDGITASVILSLGLFRDLMVKSQNSSFAYKNSGKSSEEIAAELKASYLVEGSIRKSADKVRISVQLIESANGNQVWGKQYDAELEDILELEQELSQTIAATISGRIGHTLQQSAAHKSAKNLQSFDYLLRGLYYFGKFTAGDFANARREIGKCLEIDPDNATAHTNLGMIHWVEVLEGWSEDQHNSEKLTRHHLEAALEIDPDNSLAHAYLGEYLFFKREYDKSEFHIDKAIELNPTASEGYVAKADLLNTTRRSEEAIPYADKGLQLDPHSVGAGWSAGGVYQRTGQFEKAIKTYRSIPHPPTSIHALIAACFVGLGFREEAAREMQRYHEIARQEMPDYPRNEEEWRRLWCISLASPYEEDFEKAFGELVEAGLLEDLAGGTDESPSIAVLPFENMSGDPEQEHFADGITTDIIATLSKFPHLRTISRYSTLQYKTDKPSIGTIAEEQNARYLLQGSVRKSGERIRVSAELIDSHDASICWSERYDRDLDDLFAVQDELTRQIALAMKIRLDDGEMAAHRSKGATSIRAWELTMAAVDLQETYIRQNILESRAMAEKAIGLDPDYAYAWITYGWTFWQEAYSGWSDSIDDLIDEAIKANRHAMSLDPDYGEAWIQAGMNHQMRHEFDESIAACLKGVELEPGSAEAHALTAFAYLVTGACDEARKYEQNMRKLCPILPNWYHLVSGGIEKKSGNLDQAIVHFQQGLEVEPDSPLCRFYLIDALMEKGDETRAQQLASEIRALDSSVTGKGLVHANSSDPDERQRFHDNLARFDLA
jgi:TolB-like protein/Flp pilus assembly protein TadD